ncbi:hypothetical protein BH11MYX3_BH11MYX3_46200 [soil metagenome]
MPRWLITTLRLTAIVAGASIVSAIGLLMFRAVAPIDTLRPASGELGNYLQTVGGIYAVLLAFVVFVVWNQYDQARGHIDRESTALIDLHRTASGLPIVTRNEIQAGLRAYVSAVLHDEWPAMRGHDEATISRVGERLDRVWLAIHRCVPTSECQHTIYSEVLSRFNDLTDVRTSRLTSSRQRIPLPMKILLYAGAVIMVGSMYLMVFDPLWVHLTATAALSGAIAHILFLIVDLDDPFSGRYTMAGDPYRRALAAFERDTHLVDAIEPNAA